MKSLFARTDRSVLGRWWWTIDRPLLAAFLTLIVFGIVLVAAASPPVAERIGAGQYHFVIKHMIFLVPGVVIMFGVSLLDPRNIWRLGTIMLAGSVFALLLVLMFGMEVKGAQRWLSLPFFSLQPSEFVKPAFAVVAAWLMARQTDHPEFRGQFAALGIYALIVILLISQPDLGMTVVLSAIYGAQLLLAGFPLAFIFALVLLGAGGLVGAYFGLEHVRSRIDRFLDPDSGDTYQVDKALEAFRHGGLFGTGPGQGSVKLGLPDAHADFIFAVSGEELGLFFSAVVLALFVFILLRGFNRIAQSDDMFTVLAAGGLLTMFGFQAFVHMGSSMHLLPAKGMTLPFISYGGSSLLAVAFTAGMILALTRRQGRAGVRRSGISRGSVAAGGV